MSFKRDKGRGDRGEKILKKELERLEFSVETVDKQNRSAYDLVGRKNNSEYTFEVKYDYLASSTGNLCIEYFNCKKQKGSGLSVSKADFWIYIIRDGKIEQVWLTKTDRLRQYLVQNPPYKSFNGAGDGNADVLLYRLDDILTIFVRLDLLEEFPQEL